MGFSKSKGFKILIAIFSILVVALLGSIFVNLGMDWFNGLNRPNQWIPNIIIPIVWTIIYITYGVVLTIWINTDSLTKGVCCVLVVNGVLNVVWCFIFFTLQLTFVGNIVIILNLFASINLFLQTYKYRPVYAIITSIYPIWLSVATSLNLALWILN